MPSIAELRAHPDKYAGQTVRIAGKLTECAGWECSICPEEMTSATADPKGCLPLSFRPLMEGTGFGADAVEQVFRFASVTVEGKFDPTCLRTPCLDRQSVLHEVEVVTTRQRRKSRLGLWLGDRTPLVPLGKADAEAVVAAAYRAGFPEGSSREEKDPEMAALLREFDPLIRAFGISGHRDTAVVCWAPSFAGTDMWPDSVEGALAAQSIDDHYRCNEVRKLEGDWTVQVRG
jgi:hypothetical protein